MLILVIDDDRGVRDMMDVILCLEGHQAHLAADGTTGLDAARTLLPDVIVLDIMMPGMTGWDVATELRRDPATADIPIVFCSALDDDQSIIDGWRSGASSFICKPFDPVRLTDELDRIRAAQPVTA